MVVFEKMFKQVDVHMEKKTLDVDRLTMTETGGDYTDMDFSNTQHNAAPATCIWKKVKTWSPNYRIKKKTL